MSLSESRAVLALLGFDSVRDFSRRCGINEQTASAILGLRDSPHHQRHYIVIAVHEILHTTYAERKAHLSKSARALIVGWAKRWKKDVLGMRLFVDAPGKMKDSSTHAVVRDRLRKRKIVRDSILSAFNALEWTK